MPSSNHLAPERSSYILALAEELGLPIRPEELAPVDDATYSAFRERYWKWATLRDQAVTVHLSQANLFRTYIPYKQRVFSLAYQVLWYYDEIVVRDPVGRILQLYVPGNDPDHLEKGKAYLVQLLQLLFRFRQSLESGYLLLAGDGVLPKRDDSVPSSVQELLNSNPDLMTSLDNSVRYSMKKINNRQGTEGILYQATLDYAWMKAANLTLGPLATYEIDITAEYPRATLEEIAEALKVTPEELMLHVRGMYPKEVYAIIFSLALAAALNSSVLFDRSLDGVILSNYEGTHTKISTEKLSATTGVLNVALPYIGNLPPESLIDLREAMPESFKEFRANMVEIFAKAQKDHPDDPATWAKLEFDKRMASADRAMKADMIASARKAKIFSSGGSLAILTGVLAGAYHYLPVTGSIPVVLGGVVALLNAAANYTSEQAKVGLTHPFHFLWQARSMIPDK